MALEDPSEWLPELFKRNWDTAVQSLRDHDEVDLTAARTEIWPAHDRRSGGNLHGVVRCKVYEVGDQTWRRVTHGDLDVDVNQEYAVDLQSKDGGDQARRSIHECTQVLRRVLELSRRNPHPDWNSIEEIRVTTPNNYPDYQQRIILFKLNRYGKILPPSVRLNPANT